MAKKRLEKWREADLDELYHQLEEINAEYMQMLSLVRAGGSVEKPGEIRALKRERARLKTIINEKEREG